MTSRINQQRLGRNKIPQPTEKPEQMPLFLLFSTLSLSMYEIIFDLLGCIVPYELYPSPTEPNLVVNGRHILAKLSTKVA